MHKHLYRSNSCAAFVAIIALALSGCAASRALDEQPHKDLGVLQPGTDRDLVRVELGTPIKSVQRDNCEVFAFQEGSTGWKYVRAMGYTLLDVGTLGLSEVATNPVEASVGKDMVQVRVCYTAGQKVAYSERLQVGKPPVLVTGNYPSVPLGTETTDATAAAAPPAKPSAPAPAVQSAATMDATSAAAPPAEPSASAPAAQSAATTDATPAAAPPAEPSASAPAAQSAAATDAAPAASVVAQPTAPAPSAQSTDPATPAAAAATSSAPAAEPAAPATTDPSSNTH